MNVVKSALLAMLATSALIAMPATAGNCRKIHADLDEIQSTRGCNPGLASCFLGEVDGNHGLRGVTHFNGDAGAAGPATSPGFISYSGPFEYRLEKGSLTMRETGVTTSGPAPGVVTAYQKIVSGTGEFAGATGYVFVSGLKDGNGLIETFINGEICFQK